MSRPTEMFLPFVLSVDVMVGRKFIVVLFQLRRIMAEKREVPLLQLRGWVNRRIAVAIARLYSRMIRRDGLPSPLRERDPGWDPQSGIGLAG